MLFKNETDWRVYSTLNKVAKMHKISFRSKKQNFGHIKKHQYIFLLCLDTVWSQCTAVARKTQTSFYLEKSTFIQSVGKETNIRDECFFKTSRLLSEHIN